MADHDAHAPERALTEENAELWKDVDKGYELHSLKAEYLVLMPRFNCMYAVAKMKNPQSHSAIVGATPPQTLCNGIYRYIGHVYD